MRRLDSRLVAWFDNSPMRATQFGGHISWFTSAWLVALLVGCLPPAVLPPSTPVDPTPEPNPDATPAPDPDPNPSPTASRCQQKDVYIINVRHDGLGDSCFAKPKNLEVQCVLDRLEKHLPNCVEALDIFVPGTNQEDGNYKQFTSMFGENRGRGRVSIMYENATLWDAATYDQSVINGTHALKLVLSALESSPYDKKDVRVFGHSKGAHIVAHVSSVYTTRNWVRFWAFAVPGRTRVPISRMFGDFTGPVGKAGYIEKASDNLVTATWLNDEVRLYTGKKHNGVMSPQAFEYPGRINDEGTRGGELIPNRMDHHNNYGGEYTEMSCPFYATGDDRVYDDLSTGSKPGLSCNKKRVTFKPWFWGNEGCRSLALGAMEEKEGTRYFIGPSGPRRANCRPASPIDMTVSMRYTMQRNAFSKNSIGFEVWFHDYEKPKAPAIAKLKPPNAKKKQKGWKDFKRTVRLPYSFTVRLKPKDFGGNKVDNTIHIAWMRARFRNPVTGKKITRYIIGPQWDGDGATPFEGQDHAKSLAGAKKAGWNKDKKDTSNWDIFKSQEIAGRPPKRYESLKLMGDGNDGQEGFYKYISLVD